MLVSIPESRLPMSDPEVFCVMCSKPVDLTIDLNTDETGKAVH